MSTSNTGKRFRKNSKSARSGQKTKKKANCSKSKRLVKRKRKSISYEYQIISHETWEYADVFKGGSLL